MTDAEGSPAARGVGAGILLLVVTAVISGVSTFLNAYATQGTSSDVFVSVRNLAVAVLIAPMVLAARGTSRPGLTRDQIGQLLLIGLIGGAIPFLLFFQGLQLAASAHGGLTASFLYRTLFLLASVLSLTFLRERFHWRIVLGAALLLGGNYLLLSMGSPVWTDGSLYVLAATLLWAVEYTLSKRLLQALPSGTVALGRMGFGAAFLFGFLGLTGQITAVGALGAAQWTWVGISALLLTGFVVCWYAGLQRVDLGVASSVLVLGFPVTWLLSLLVGSAPLTASPEGLGAVLVAIGVGTMVGFAYLRQTWAWLRTLWPDRQAREGALRGT